VLETVISPYVELLLTVLLVLVGFLIGYIFFGLPGA